jgi:hypothetical protein
VNIIRIAYLGFISYPLSLEGFYMRFFFSPLPEKNKAIEKMLATNKY